MKRFSIVVVLILLIGSVGVGIAKPLPADPAINAFWEKFKAAVIKGDKEAVFAMSALPIGMSFGESNIRTKAQFMKSYRNIFADQVNAAKCFNTAKPQVDKTRRGEFFVTCPFAKDSSGEEPFGYTFKLTRVGWRFVRFENVNE